MHIYAASFYMIYVIYNIHKLHSLTFRENRQFEDVTLESRSLLQQTPATEAASHLCESPLPPLFLQLVYLSFALPALGAPAVTAS